MQSEALQVAHMKETKRIIQFMIDTDLHSNKDVVNVTEKSIQEPKQHIQQPKHETKPNNYSTITKNEDRWASSSGSSSNTNNSLFNKVYYSGR